MQDLYWKKLENSLSADRLAVYGQDNPGYRVIAGRYLWNIAVCEAMYAPIHLLEVGLRNGVDHAMRSVVGGGADWYDRVALTPWGRERVFSAKSTISRSGKSVTPGRVIAELPFGFWTAMFESHFESRDARFLPSGIKATFPLMPKSLHKRKRIKADLDKVRLLRNRIFHHERIIHWQDLAQQHELVRKFIGWLDRDLSRLAEIIDDFPQVHAAGHQQYLDKLDSMSQ